MTGRDGVSQKPFFAPQTGSWADLKGSAGVLEVNERKSSVRVRLFDKI